MDKHRRIVMGCGVLLWGTLLTGLALHATASAAPAGSTQDVFREALNKAKKGDKDAITKWIYAINHDTIHLADKWVPEFAVLLQSRNPQVQLLGVTGLSAMAGPACREPLIAYLTSIEVKKLDRKTLPKVEGQFPDTLRWQLQAAELAVRTLGRVGNEKCISLIESFRNVGFLNLADPVGEALIRLGSVKSFTSLPPNADSREVSWASQNLRRINDPNKAEELIEVVRNPGHGLEVRLMALQALCRMDTPRVVSFLAGVARNKSYAQPFRTFILMSLAKNHNPPVGSLFLDLSMDSDPSVRTYALTGLMVHNPGAYANRWFDAIMDPDQTPEVRKRLMQLRNWVPGSILQDHREQLYRCLAAAEKDGRPCDEIRVQVWVAIYLVLGEEKPVVLSDRSSRVLETIRNAVNINLYWDKRRPPEDDCKKQIDEIVQRSVSFLDESAQPPK